MPKIVNHELYRKELLSKCFDLFAERGYSAITMRQVAESLGVSTGTLYHYFPNKKALFEQLVEEICERDVSLALTELEGIQTLKERLEVLGRFLVKKQDYYVKWTYVLVDFCQHLDFKEMHGNDVFQYANKQYEQAFYELLGIKDRALVWFVMSLIDGLFLELLMNNDCISLTEQFDLLGKMITAYLEKYQSSDQ
ncbi:TetR/AcrR family transcriptional regulator [Scytonema sp. NUACC26]|uniref:TetR/AcrR family transcriptional regulator n=1 Tax=Scytonema sp. NUACC26 TaxID=3140176 RepID=UPI0034DBA296